MERSERRKKLIQLKRDLVELQRVCSYGAVSRSKLIVDRIRLETKIAELEEENDRKNDSKSVKVWS